MKSTGELCLTMTMIVSRDGDRGGTGSETVLCAAGSRREEFSENAVYRAIDRLRAPRRVVKENECSYINTSRNT